jgi:ATP adenylyltransferase
MDYLWTPWRFQYVTKTGDGGECVFCAAAQSDRDEECLVVYRGQHNFVILNRFPYTTGHIMVVPHQHVATLEDLADETLVEMIRLSRDCERHLRTVYRPDGINLGINLGRSAGAGIAGHVHMHMLPRWTGDTNFMTVVGETRVLPEDLSETWQKLSRAFRNPAAGV